MSELLGTITPCVSVCDLSNHWTYQGPENVYNYLGEGTNNLPREIAP